MSYIDFVKMGCMAIITYNFRFIMTAVLSVYIVRCPSSSLLGHVATRHLLCRAGNYTKIQGIGKSLHLNGYGWHGFIPNAFKQVITLKRIIIP